MNPFTDCSGFLCTELLYQPLLWVVGVLAVITAANAVTQWNNVAWNGARAIRMGYGYPMIHSQRVPKAGRSTTRGATAVEVVKGILPIVGRKISRRIVAFYFVVSAPYSVLATVVSVMTFVNARKNFRPSLSVLRSPLFSVSGFGAFAVVLAKLVYVFFSILLIVSALVVFVGYVPFFVFLTGIVAVELVPAAISFLCAFWIVFCPLLSFSVVTRFAIVTKAISCAFVSMKKLRGNREFFAAYCAALKGRVILALHIEPPFGVPSPRLLAQCWDSLFTPPIIPQKRFVLWT